MMVRS